MIQVYIQHSRQKVSMFIHLILSSLICLMYPEWNLSHSLEQQTFSFTSQSPVHESSDRLSQHRLYESTRVSARNDFMLGQIAKMAPVYENRKENKQVSSGRNYICEDDKHELCQVIPLKSLTALESACDWACGRRQSHPGGHEPAIINKPPPKHVRPHFVPAVLSQRSRWMWILSNLCLWSIIHLVLERGAIDKLWVQMDAAVLHTNQERSHWCN